MAHDDVRALQPPSPRSARHPGQPVGPVLPRLLLNRRGFLAGAAALGAGLVTAGCAGTYDVASGITGSSGGDNRSTLVYWNLLSGGDGAHMQSMEAVFAKAHPNIDLQSTILQWGSPYYTKLSLAIRSGSPPDVAIMHLSRIHQYGPPGMLTPLSPDLLAAAWYGAQGLHPAGLPQRALQRPAAGHPAGHPPVRPVLQHQDLQEGGPAGQLRPAPADQERVRHARRTAQAEENRRDPGGLRLDQRPGHAVAIVLQPVQPGRRPGAGRQRQEDRAE